ncbi:MAG TPA: N-6 DNA methylase [Xanthobacteraceae bacterium]|nr:N-6 DNA methylase [Xanthobacteraceae bacterium]
MAKSTKKTSNEMEFQGQVVSWLNDYIAKHPSLGLETATQEKPHKTTAKRNDVVVWRDRAALVAFLTIELKTPTTPLNDPSFFSDALNKGRQWGSRYFALWNMRELELYETVPVPHIPVPTDVINRSAHPLAVTQVEDWLKPEFKKQLHDQSIELIDSAIHHSVVGVKHGHTIDPELFVSRLTDALASLRIIFYRDLKKAAGVSKKLRKQLTQIAATQGFEGFVQDIDHAIAGQIGYRFIGQILFYFALRRKLPSLKELKIATGDILPAAFAPFWNDVRAYDYEALFKPQPVETLIPIGKDAQSLLRRLIDQLSAYDWASLTDDVLGSIFEHLIPRKEQILLGQFYTPRPVADLLVASTIDGERPFVADPACGSGTFLMSAYSYLAYSAHLSHKDLLSIIWGFDVSPFAAEVAVINLYRQDMAQYENFPRVNVKNFFELQPGQTIDFPASQHASGTSKVPVPVPPFDCIVGNPPYLRSQNQDDLNPEYRETLFTAAVKAGFNVEAKTDLFAFFVYHSTRFMKDGSRLGFVTPASWLTSDYAISLQKALLGTIRVRSIISSSAESFFPQVDVNAVLLVAEKCPTDAPLEPIHFVTLKKPIATLTGGEGEYWARVMALAGELESFKSIENERYRIKMVDANTELTALNADKTRPRNWSKYLRAPLSYYEIFESVS